MTGFPRSGCSLVVALVLGGCTADPRGSASEGVTPADASVAPSDTLSPEPRDTDELELGVRLYDQKLLALPEVRASMRRHVRMYQEGQLPRAEAMARFRVWLELWIADHPDVSRLVAQASRPPAFVGGVAGPTEASLNLRSSQPVTPRQQP